MSSTIRLRGFAALSPGMEQVVRDLCDRCAVVDGSPPRVHWPLAQRRRDGLVHQLAVREGEVIGYGCAYHFDPGEAEIVVAVDPAHRRAGVGRAIWRELSPQLERWSSPTWLGFVPRSPDGQEGWRPPGGTSLRIERWMTCRRVATIGTVHETTLSLVEATMDDFEHLAELDAESFGSTVPLVLERLRRHCDGVRRRAYLAYEGERVVGKIHLRADANTAHVHDLCIRPEHRGRGLGLAMVARATQLVLEQFDEATLDVEAPNEAAVRLYEKVGFEASASWTALRFTRPRTARE